MINTLTVLANGRDGSIDGLYTTSEGSRIRAVKILLDQYQRLATAATMPRSVGPAVPNTTTYHYFQTEWIRRAPDLLEGQAIILKDTIGLDSQSLEDINV